MVRIVLHFTKLGALGYISHLDFQRLWQRLFRIAGIEVAHSNGFNPRPRIRFAVPLATGFYSEGELLEVYLNHDLEVSELVDALNASAPQGLKVLSATRIPQEFPKLTALIDALAYHICLPDRAQVELREVGNEVETRSGTLNLREYLLAMDVIGCDWKLLIKTEGQKTVRPDVIGHHFFPEFDPVQFKITRIGLYTLRRELESVPQGLSILFD